MDSPNSFVLPFREADTGNSDSDREFGVGRGTVGMAIAVRIRPNAAPRPNNDQGNDIVDANSYISTNDYACATLNRNDSNETVTGPSSVLNDEAGGSNSSSEPSGEPSPGHTCFRPYHPHQSEMTQMSVVASPPPYEYRPQDIQMQNDVLHMHDASDAGVYATIAIGDTISAEDSCSDDSSSDDLSSSDSDKDRIDIAHQDQTLKFKVTRLKMLIEHLSATADLLMEELSTISAPEAYSVTGNLKPIVSALARVAAAASTTQEGLLDRMVVIDASRNASVPVSVPNDSVPVPSATPHQCSSHQPELLHGNNFASTQSPDEFAGLGRGATGITTVPSRFSSILSIMEDFATGSRLSGPSGDTPKDNEAPESSTSECTK